MNNATLYPTLALALAFTLSKSLTVNGDVWISEIRTDQPGIDTDEYLELYSPGSDTNLNDLSYLVIGDGPAGSGVIETVINLNGLSFASGRHFFLIAEPTFSINSRTADLTIALNFENNDNVTHLLVRDFNGNLGQDLDTNDDGILDTTPWNTVIDGISLVKTISAGDKIYAPILDLQSLGPDGSFPPTHVYRENNIEGFSIGSFTLGEQDTPGASNSNVDQIKILERTIPQIQGTDSASPFVGNTVTTSGIVVGDFQKADELRGFFLQDSIGDANPASSDGIFVFDRNGPAVSVGDRIEVTGLVTEFNGLTEISRVSSIKRVGTGLISPTRVTLPETLNGELERYEGMLIQISSTMTISQNFFLNRYGQLTLSSPNDSGQAGRLFQPTQLFPPGTKADQLADDNQRRILVLDDGQDINPLGDFPNPIPYLENSPSKVIRAGDQVSNLIGVLDYGRINSNQSDPGRDYRLQPTVAPVFRSTNPRPPVPSLRTGNLTVASFNVLNYFLTLDQRGANTRSERMRQRTKLVTAMRSIDADILGLIEVENDAGASVQDLVTELNRSIGTNSYKSIQSGKIGLDAIKTALIYKQDTVTPVGTPQVLDDNIDPRALSNRNRPALAQTFRHRTSNDALTIVVNHFKSRGSPCNDIGDPNTSDGQGNCNGTRTSMARAMVDWLATGSTSGFETDVLIIGDLNAYAKEDPIRTIEDRGFVNLIEQFQRGHAYTYTFDGQAGYLDHALASDSLSHKVLSVDTWHINTDESTAWDYHIIPNSLPFFQANEFRSSDHDPIIVRIQMGTDVPPSGSPSTEISSIQHEGTHLRLQFTGSPGKIYKVEFTDKLTSPQWHTIATVRADPQGRITFLDQRPVSFSGFFRIQLNLLSEEMTF